MTKRSELGQFGENLACEYLVKNGYRILTRNYWKPWGEIDIIGRSREGALVFFEVKTMRDAGSNGLVPEDNLSSSKLKKLQRTCGFFAAKNPELVNEQKGWQIDLLAITLRGLTFNKENCIINHCENI